MRAYILQGKTKFVIINLSLFLLVRVLEPEAISNTHSNLCLEVKQNLTSIPLSQVSRLIRTPIDNLT